jgi:beta-galactosidase GanA
MGALSLPAKSAPAKQALLNQIKRRYDDISKLNAAWRTTLVAWPALEGPWKPVGRVSEWSGGLKADLAAFVKELAPTYFRTVRERLQAADPDHRYLGCRFAWHTQKAVAAAGEYCDGEPEPGGMSLVSLRR